MGGVQTGKYPNKSVPSTMEFIIFNITNESKIVKMLNDSGRGRNIAENRPLKSIDAYEIGSKIMLR